MHQYWPFNLHANGRFCWPLDPTALSTGSGCLRRRPLISTNQKHQRHMQTFERRHRSCIIGAVRESPRAPPDMHPLLPRLSSSLSGQTLLLLRTTTDLHVATNKRRCVFEQALFFPSAVRQQKSNLTSKPLHTYIHTVFPHPVSKHGLIIRPIQCPRIDTPVSPSKVEPLAVKVHKCERHQAAGA